MDWLGNRLDFKEMNAWYGITAKQIYENGGVTLLNKYGNSPSKLVMAVYDTHPWQQPCFNTVRRLWHKEDQRNFMDWLGNRLHFKEMNAWYGITINTILKSGGVTLLNKYENSPFKSVMAVYDTHPWQQSKFQSTRSKLQQGHWENKENRIAAIRDLGRELKIKEMSDWYRISSSQMKEIDGVSRLLYNHPLEKLLPESYPHHQWDIGTLEGKGKFVTASQRWLKIKVEELFPQSGMKVINKSDY
jgi:hypothetical protein